MISTTRFDENSGRIDTTKASKIKAEAFPISEQGYMIGKVLDGTDCQILLDTGQANISYVNDIIYDVNLYIYCKNLLLKCREFK